MDNRGFEASSFKPASSKVILSSTPMPHIYEMGDYGTTASPVKYRCPYDSSTSSSQDKSELSSLNSSSYETLTFKSFDESCAKSTKPKLAQGESDGHSFDIKVHPSFVTGNKTPEKFENVFGDLSITEYVSTLSPTENMCLDDETRVSKNCVLNLDNSKQAVMSEGTEDAYNGDLIIDLNTVADVSNIIPPTDQKSNSFLKCDDEKELRLIKSNANEESDACSDQDEETEYHQKIRVSANASVHNTSPEKDIYLSSRSISFESKANETNSRRSYQNEDNFNDETGNFNDGEITDMSLHLAKSCYDTSKELSCNEASQNIKCPEDLKCDGDTQFLSLDEEFLVPDTVKSTNEVYCTKCGNLCIEIDEKMEYECIKEEEECKIIEEIIIKPSKSIKLLYDLFEVDNIISRNILLLLSSDFRNGATITEIANHLKIKEISGTITKLRNDAKSFLNAGISADIIQLKTRRYSLKGTLESQEILNMEENTQNMKSERINESYSNEDLNVPEKMKLRKRKSDDNAQQEKRKKLPEKKSDETKKRDIIKKENDDAKIPKKKTLSNGKSVDKNIKPENARKVLKKDGGETKKGMEPRKQDGVGSSKASGDGHRKQTGTKRSEQENAELPKRKKLKTDKDADKPSQPETGKKMSEKDKNETKSDAKIRKQNTRENTKSTNVVAKELKTMKQKTKGNLTKSTDEGKNEVEKVQPEKVKVARKKVITQEECEHKNTNSKSNTKTSKESKSAKSNTGKKSIAKDAKCSLKVPKKSEKVAKPVAEAAHKMKLRGTTK